MRAVLVASVPTLRSWGTVGGEDSRGNPRARHLCLQTHTAVDLLFANAPLCFEANHDDAPFETARTAAGSSAAPGRDPLQDGLCGRDHGGFAIARRQAPSDTASPTPSDRLPPASLPRLDGTDPDCGEPGSLTPRSPVSAFAEENRPPGVGSKFRVTLLGRGAARTFARGPGRCGNARGPFTRSEAAEAGQPVRSIAPGRPRNGRGSFRSSCRGVFALHRAWSRPPKPSQNAVGYPRGPRR